MTHSSNSSQSVTAGGRKSEHYPSLELCKKLTEAGFHNTNLAWFTNTHCKTKSWIMDCGEMDKFKRYVCPSVMELLDCTPIDKIDIWYSYPDWRLKLKENTTSDVRNETFPNALAEMWLHLKQNNYLTK